MTAPLPALISVADVADALGETEHFVKQRCRRHEWPHRRLGRGRVAFTAADYLQILALIAEPVEASEPTGLAFAPRSRRAS